MDDRQLARLEGLALVTAAHVLLGQYRDQDPPFLAAVHLKIPGHNIYAAESDHTLATTWKRVGEELYRQVVLLRARRRQKRKTRIKMGGEPASV